MEASHLSFNFSKFEETAIRRISRNQKVLKSKIFGGLIHFHETPIKKLSLQVDSREMTSATQISLPIQSP